MQKEPNLSRRQFLTTAGGTVIRIGLPGLFVKLTDTEKRAYAAQLRPDGRPRIPPGQEAVKALYDMGGTPGPGRVPDWQLSVTGAVANSKTFTLQDLLRFPQVNLTCDVHCVTGWTLLDAKWRGIRLTTIMDAVGVTKKARFIIFKAPEGYSSNIPISDAQKDNLILAHTFFGNNLLQAHGAPLRALVPDRYFYKSAKWIEGIKFTIADEPGYWEKGGYSNSADPWKEERFD